MKKTLLVLFVVLLIIIGYAYLYPDKARIVTDAVQETVKKIPDPGDLIPQTTTLYKWKDPDGHWQVQDTPPPAGTDYEKLHYRHDTNVMAPVAGPTNE